MSVRDEMTFNGKHSYKDFNVWLQEKKIQPPAKVKIKKTIPFMNGTYDFSTVGSDGDQVYGERKIQVKIGLPTKSKEELYIVYQLLLEWLEDTGRQELMFDNIPGFYFIAEVEEAPEFEETIRMGNLTINFIAQPFKVSTSYMGDDIWDTFCFLTDYTQYTNEFTINGSTTVTMYNNGRPITPTINCSSAMTLTCNGNGIAKIIFRWEVL